MTEYRITWREGGWSKELRVTGISELAAKAMADGLRSVKGIWAVHLTIVTEQLVEL